MCDTPKHTGYMIYAAVMIILCKFDPVVRPLKLADRRVACLRLVLARVRHGRRPK